MSELQVVYLSLLERHLVHLGAMGCLRCMEQVQNIFPNKEMYGGLFHLRLSEVQEIYLTVFEVDGPIIVFEVHKR